MKKLASNLILSLALILNITLIGNVFAAEIPVGGACGTLQGCPITSTNTTYPLDSTQVDTCSQGTICSLKETATASYDPLAPCVCQKAFGAGLGSIRGQAGLSDTSVPAIVGSVIKVILGISGTVALIFIIWGGIKWMISKGEAEAIKKARQLMTSGMVGIAIIAAAYAITDFVIKQITVVAGA